MDNLFLLLLLLSFLALVIGIIKPNLVIRWGNIEKRNRKNVFKFYGLSVIIFFILFGMSIPSTETSNSEDDTIKIEQKRNEEKQSKREEETKVEIEDVVTKGEKENKQEKEEIQKEEGKGNKQEKGESEKKEDKEDNRKSADFEIMDVNYLLMWHKYSEDTYKDKYVRIAGNVGHVGKDTINIREGLSGITGNIYLKFDKGSVNELEFVSEGDYIIATGKCGQKTAGQISIENVNIEVIGDKAFQKANEYKETADKIFEQERLEAQKLEKEEMADYKTKSITIKYEDLIREPYKYKGEIIEVTMKISQIMSGGLLTEAGYAGKQGKEEWFVNYKLPEYSPRILEGDTIRFYGEFDDVREMKRALTKTKVFIPKLNAKYFELIK